MNYIREFIEDLIREGKAPNTIKSYDADLRYFTSWFEKTTQEPLEPKNVTQVDTRSYFNHLVKEKRYKPATVNRRVIALKRYLEWAAAMGHSIKNTAQSISTIDVPLDAPKALSKLEARRLLREVEKSGNERDICVMQLLLDTGIRVSELCGIKLADIESSERRGILSLPYNKGAKSRTVPISKNARDAIGKYLAVRPLSAHAILICGQRGPMTPSGVFRIVKSYGDRIGIKVSPHVMRHTLATKLLREDKQDIVLVQRLLGHSNLNTTSRYTRPSEDDLMNALEDINY